jgi:hypothetical protein
MFAIGVRDRISFDAIAQTYGEVVSSKLFLSGDDAVPYIVENALDNPNSNGEDDAEIEFDDGEFGVNVQMSLEDYITDEPEILIHTVAFCIREIKRLYKGKISVNLVSGYEDRGTSETAHLEKLKACLGDGDIEFNLVIGLSDLHRGFSQMRNADLTICCSYHTTLTSLVLGIPTVTLYTNPYYAHKHRGLSLDFGIPRSMVFDVGQGQREHLSRALERIVSSPGWRRRLSARAVRGNTAMAARNESAALMLSEFLAAGRLAELEERYRATKAALAETGTVMPYVGLLAVGVLGVANYWRQWRQRKMYSARTAAVVGHCRPAWWASPITAILPLAYYAWRSRAASTGHPPDMRSCGSPTGLSLPVALLAAAAEERLQDIGQLNEVLSQKEGVIAKLAKAAEERLRVIEELDAALRQKEGIIADPNALRREP